MTENMKPTHILALTNMDNTLSLKEAVDEIKIEHGDIIDLKKIYFQDWENADVSIEKLVEQSQKADIIIVDVRGDLRLSREMASLASGKTKTVVVLIAGSRDIFALTRMGKFEGKKIFKAGKEKEFDVTAFQRTKKFSALTKKLGALLPFGMLKDMRNWILAQEYYSEGDTVNLKNMLLLLLKQYGGHQYLKNPDPPHRAPAYGLYLPGSGLIEDLETYYKEANYRASLPVVGILLYGGMHFHDTAPVADAIYERLQDHVNLICIFSNAEYNLEALEKYLPDVDLLINLQYFRLYGGPYGGDPEKTYQFLKKKDVPVLIGLRAFETEIKTWKEENRGLSPLEVILGITLPELDGAIEPVFVSAMESFADSDIGRVKRQAVLEKRVDKLSRRTLAWLNLRRKANSAKKVALLIYDYPPGESNLGSAGYLDVFASLEAFLKKMQKTNYNFDLPGIKMHDFFLEQGLINLPQYHHTASLRLSVPDYLKWFNELDPELQNEIISSWGNPPGDIMVEGDEIILPAHESGNLFLGVQPARGVQGNNDNNYHNRGIAPTHQYLAFYFYLQKIFKADALIHFGMHGTLEFNKGKEVALSAKCFPDVLIGDIPHIYYYWLGNTSEATIAKRRSYALCVGHGSPAVKNSGLYEQYLVLEDLLDQWEKDADKNGLDALKKQALLLHMSQDPARLRNELYKMKRRLIPDGLYIMDQKWPQKDLAGYIYGVLRHDRNYPSILKIIAKQKALDWEAVKAGPEGMEVESLAEKLVPQLIENKGPDWLPEGYQEFVLDIVNNVRSSKEAKNLLRALDGRYIEASMGGDPIRNPEVYPSGRSIYAFDPRLVPTIAAQVRGGRAVESMLEMLKAKNGRWPETVALVLWGFETMKTGGDTIASILSLLGVRLRKKSTWFKELEVIPLEELKRPRIDVMINICGIFRDTFSTHLELLNRAVALVAELPEKDEENYVRKHCSQMQKELGSLSKARIFGPSPQEYATNLTTQIENGLWKNEDDLAKSFESSMEYAYLNGRTEKTGEAYSKILSTVEAIAQERDNHEYEVTDLDHYYEFMGGLSASLRKNTGNDVPVLVVDTTEEEVEVEPLEEVIKRASRTRLFNPAWIDGMLKHDFCGAKKIKDRVEYLLGFAATTNCVQSWIFDEVGNRLIFDENMRRRLQDNNPYAAVKIGELLMEIAKRGYWKAEPEKIEKLRSIVMQMDGEAE